MHPDQGMGESNSDMSEHTLTTEQVLHAPIDRVFAFFADAGNLEAITPEFLNFRILTPRPIAMHPGALIDYALTLNGLPMKWRTRISAWEPPATGPDGRRRARFVDEQLRGPYALWVHEHTFEELPDSLATVVRDLVTYRVPGGILSAPVHRWFVRPRLEKIFAFRSDATERLIAQAPAAAPAR